ncbi:hypothetical protein N9J72_00580 [Candidatus Gracilibacteria bacterium]|nr:hypothetical protein [Candidatus Gracilibacteria bacterium]
MALEEYRKNTVEENTGLFNTELQSILSGKSVERNSRFDVDYFNNLKTKKLKVSYILSIFEGFTINTIIQVSENTGLKASVLTRIINQKLSDIASNNENVPQITIAVSYLHKILKEETIS